MTADMLDTLQTIAAILTVPTGVALLGLPYVWITEAGSKK